LISLNRIVCYAVENKKKKEFEMMKTWSLNLVWIAAAALLGFAIAAIFAGVLQLPRRIYLIPYVGLAGLFFYAYLSWSGMSILNLLRHNWYWGLLGAVLLGIFTIRNVLSQPASSQPGGLSLAFDIVWSGVVYGLIDALLLSVLPVLATWSAFSSSGLTTTLHGKILVGILAIIASLLVTGAYHLGYPEYRGPGLFGPVIGNGAMTIGYLLTNNPIAAIFSHIAMHIAGVLHGAASVTQLPPHYLP
jgi:hypothetical protein